MIEKLLSDIRREEGWRGYAYDDSNGKAISRAVMPMGYATVGYGFCIDAQKGHPLPQVVAEFWLRHLVDELMAEIPHQWPAFDLQDDDVKRALVQMAYQMGVAGLLKFKLMLNALERGDRDTAAANALGSKWAQQTPQRAARVADLIRGYQ